MLSSGTRGRQAALAVADGNGGARDRRRLGNSPHDLFPSDLVAMLNSISPIVKQRPHDLVPSDLLQCSTPFISPIMKVREQLNLAH